MPLGEGKPTASPDLSTAFNPADPPLYCCLTSLGSWRQCCACKSPARASGHSRQYPGRCRKLHDQDSQRSRPEGTASP